MAMLLKDVCPDLAKQVKDKSLLDTLIVSDHKKIDWCCNKGHEWSASVNSRVYAKVGCPICSNRKIVKGINDLATIRPDLAKELVNINDGYKYSIGSHKKVKWKCEKGHVWESAINKRTLHNQMCPICRGKRIVKGINDLCTRRPDIAKYLVNKDLGHSLALRSNKIVDWCCDKGHKYSRSVVQTVNANGDCPICKGKRLVKGVNTIGDKFPELANELVDKSLKYKISPYSNERVEWECKYGHRWMAQPNDRVVRHSGCPVCINRKVVKGVNDIHTVNPDLGAELLNFEDGYKYGVNSHIKLQWKCKKGHIWSAVVCNRNHGQVCPICSKKSSKKEKKLLLYLRKMLSDDNVLYQNKSLLNNKYELDIVIPDKKIAIEFNGVYWHSEAEQSDKNYHFIKTKLCRELGYQLIHVWEDDWDCNEILVMRMLCHKLHCLNKLKSIYKDIDLQVMSRMYARKLRCCIIESKVAKDFLIKNHVQGYVSASYHFGLCDELGVIWAILSVRSPKNNARMKRGQGEWEIQRYATCGRVVGGFSKLMKCAENYLKEHEIINKWISFSDNCVSDGGMYKQCGFVVDKILKPDYKYTGAKLDWKRCPKERFQLKKIEKNKDLVFDKNLTEHENMLANKLYRIYDTGKIKWVKEIK